MKRREEKRTVLAKRMITRGKRHLGAYREFQLRCLPPCILYWRGGSCDSASAPPSLAHCRLLLWPLAWCSQTHKCSRKRRHSYCRLPLIRSLNASTPFGKKAGARAARGQDVREVKLDFSSSDMTFSTGNSPRSVASSISPGKLTISGIRVL